LLKGSATAIYHPVLDVREGGHCRPAFYGRLFAGEEVRIADSDLGVADPSVLERQPGQAPRIKDG
jgi:hypothetical protein